MPGPPGYPAPGGGGSLTRPRATTVYTPPTLPYGRAAAQFFVRREDGTPLPNVRFLGMEWHEFRPPVANFRYAFDTSSRASSYDPTRVEHCFTLSARGRRVVSVDDRIQVVRQVGRRQLEILFDGFVVAPQANLSGDGESVTFTAIGTPIREHDTPLSGAVWRDSDGMGDRPNDGTDPALPQDVATDEPVRFNPDGLPNATPEDCDSPAEDDGENSYPVFADPALAGREPIRKWSLAMAAKYCMAIGNPSGAYIFNGDLRRLDRVLMSIRPTEPDQPIDFADEDTYELEDIIIPDIDVKGACWPDAVRRLIEPHGFAFRYVVRLSAAGVAEWSVQFYRKDDVSLAKPIYFQAPGSTLIPGRSSAPNIQLTRDCAGIENEWRIASTPNRYEASFILDSEWVPTPEDLPSLYDKSYVEDGTADNPFFDPRAYRRFILGEDGAERWDRLTGTTTTEIPSLAALFDPPDAPPEGDSLFKAPPSVGTKPRTYVHRARPPIRECVTFDEDGTPREAELWVSLDYEGPAGLWDGTGTWQRISKGTWKLLDDRIGFEYTGSNPAHWNASRNGPVLKSGLLNLVTSLQSEEVTERPCFRLTCVIEGDHDMGVVAERRDSSPTGFTITRYEDADDRFGKAAISTFSHFDDLGVTTYSPDDTDEAQAHADALRRPNESGTFSGTVTVPYFTTMYGVGDKISGIIGRNIDLAMNLGREQGESPTYPNVIGVAWSFDGGQSTTLTLQDVRAEPPPETRRARL